METVNAIIKLVASVISLVATALRFVPKTRDSSGGEKQKDR